MGNDTIRLSVYDFLFDFNRNNVSMFYRFRDIAGYLSRVSELSRGFVCDPTFSRFSRTPTCDRHRQTRAQAHGYYRARIASRGKKLNRKQMCSEVTLPVKSPRSQSWGRDRKFEVGRICEKVR